MKAFNTIFGVVLAKGRPLDVFIAGDDAKAKAGVAEFIESLNLRPLDVGGLNMAHWLEGTGLACLLIVDAVVGDGRGQGQSAEEGKRVFEPPRRVRRLSDLRAQPAAGLRC